AKLAFQLTCPLRKAPALELGHNGASPEQDPLPAGRQEQPTASWSCPRWHWLQPCLHRPGHLSSTFLPRPWPLSWRHHSWPRLPPHWPSFARLAFLCLPSCEAWPPYPGPLWETWPSGCLPSWRRLTCWHRLLRQPCPCWCWLQSWRRSAPPHSCRQLA